MKIYHRYLKYLYPLLRAVLEVEVQNIVVAVLLVVVKNDAVVVFAVVAIDIVRIRLKLPVQEL